LNRYSRNLALPQIGREGQEALLEARVLVIGAGGIGAAALYYLAAAGIGHIGIVDSDRVELSNLQRQILYNTAAVGKIKATRAAEALRLLNPDSDVGAYAVRFSENNAAELCSGYDIVLDGSDNFPTRFLANATCYAEGITLVSAAVTGWQGQVATFKAHETEKYPCYRCFCPAPPGEDALPSCSEGGIMGAAAGVIGSLAAAEIIKEIAVPQQSLAGYMLRYDALQGYVKKVRLVPDPACSTCADKKVRKAAVVSGA